MNVCGLNQIYLAFNSLVISKFSFIYSLLAVQVVYCDNPVKIISCFMAVDSAG